MKTKFEYDRDGASFWAKNLLDEAKADPRAWLILDTETTGLFDSEIVQIGLLWPDGTPALDTLVKPCYAGLPYTSIPPEATAIHGITDEMVKDAPDFMDFLPRLSELMEGRKIIVYNVAFDFEILLGVLYRRLRAEGTGDFIHWYNQDKIARQKAYDWLNSAPVWECAMEQYARWFGEWNDYRRSYKWQRLVGGDHSAIGDCCACLEIIKKMAGVIV